MKSTVSKHICNPIWMDIFVNQVIISVFKLIVRLHNPSMYLRQLQEYPLVRNHCSREAFSTCNICNLISFVFWTWQAVVALIHLNIHCAFCTDVTVMSSDC